MKKNLFLLLLTPIIFSCKKNDSGSSYTPVCSGTVSYATSVSPVIASACTASGCHNSGSSNGPGVLTNYNQVRSAASSIHSSVANGSMPKNGSLTSVQKNDIMCWIDAGTANN